MKLSRLYRFAILWLLGFGLTHCTPGHNEPDPEDPGNNKWRVIITETPPDSLQLDSFSLNAVAINGDTLTLDLTHGGGCKEHFYALFMSPAAFLESFPAQANLYLRHNDNDDFCDALLQPTIRFDLRPVAELYEKFYRRRDPIRLNVYQYFQGQPGEKLSVLYQAH